MEKFFKNLMKKMKLSNGNKKGEVMSCVLCMLLVVLASQSRVFDFLIDSNLGRIALLVLVLTICVTSKTFGVASVLFVVLAFVVHMNSREGMCDKKKDDEKKEGMCDKKKTEAFESMSSVDRLNKERDLQKGQQPYKETVKKSDSAEAKPHDGLQSEYGGVY